MLAHERRPAQPPAIRFSAAALARAAGSLPYAACSSSASPPAPARRASEGRGMKQTAGSLADGRACMARCQDGGSMGGRTALRDPRGIRRCLQVTLFPGRTTVIFAQVIVKKDHDAALRLLETADIALTFARALVAKEYDRANAMLSISLKPTY